jgi:hypothetical protein
MPHSRRLARRFFSVLISLIVALAIPHPLPALDSGLTLCQIIDTLYRADGTPAQGTIVLVWNAFTTAADKLNDDAVQAAWQGEYQASSDSWALDAIPGDAVQVSVPSRGAAFNAVVRQVNLQVMSLRDDRCHYTIKFANDAAECLAFELTEMTLPAPLTTIYNTGTPSSSLYIAPLTAAQVTNVIATEVTVDAGIAPPAGGGIEVRRSDGGWGPSDSGNLAGRFNTQTLFCRVCRVCRAIICGSTTDRRPLNTRVTPRYCMWTIRYEHMSQYLHTH